MQLKSISSYPDGRAQTYPLVSILIRSIDRPLLQRALESVARQTYANIEVVVVAATPGHQQLPRRCGAFPLHLVPTDTPCPRSRAANRGLDTAKGDLLLFLDDDDWLMPDHVTRLADVLLQLPETLAVYSGVGLVDANGQMLEQTFDMAFDSTQQLIGNLTPIHSVLFRASALSQGCRFDEAFNHFEDWDFWLQIAHLAPFVHLPGVSAFYQIHESSGIHSVAGPSSAASQRIYEKWRPRWTPQNIAEVMRRAWEYPSLTKIAETRLNDLATALKNNTTLSQSLDKRDEQLSQQESELIKRAEAIQYLEGINSNLSLEVERLKAAVVQLTVEHQAILSSSSWRISAPLRWVSRALNGAAVTPSAAPQEAPADARSTVVATEGDASTKIAQSSLRPTIPPGATYQEWLQWEQQHATAERQSLVAVVAAHDMAWVARPTIAILMPCYNPPINLLDAAIESVQGQSWERWALYIVDDASSDPNVRVALERWAGLDARIRVSYAETNGHISRTSNLALANIRESFFALLDQDDLLSHDALLQVAVQVLRRPDVGIIYSDEDKIGDDGQRFSPYFKPDFNYELLLGQNTISHLGVYRTALVREVGGFRVGYEGSQDHDLALRCIEKLRPDQIVHIPRVLYHWRVHAGSTASSTDAKPYALDAGVAAVQDHLDRMEPGCKVSLIDTLKHYHVEFPLAEPLPMVTAIVVGQGDPVLTSSCIEYLLRETDYGQVKVLVLDQGSGGSLATSLPSDLTADPRVHIKSTSQENGLARLYNRAVAEAKGGMLLFLNEGVKPANRSWLQDLVRLALRKGVGVVGPAIWGGDGTMAEGGLILAPQSIATAANFKLPRGNGGYCGRGGLLQSLSAISSKCMLVRRDVFDTLGGMNEGPLSNHWHDVDFCLRAIQSGFRNLWTPFVEMFDTRSAGSCPNDESTERMEATHYMAAHWATLLECDPAYNVNLRTAVADYAIDSSPREWSAHPDITPSAPARSPCP